VLLYAERIVAHLIDSAGEAAEVFCAWQSDMDKAIEEIVHARATESDLIGQRVAGRVLYVAIDFFAVRSSGLWPVMRERPRR